MNSFILEPDKKVDIAISRLKTLTYKNLHNFNQNNKRACFLKSTEVKNRYAL